jgi:hypothetical protein
VPIDVRRARAGRRFYRADGRAPDGTAKPETIFGRDVEEIRFVRRL